MVVESGRPAASTRTETKNLAGSPAASAGIGLPAGTLTDSIVVVLPPVEAAASREMQSVEVFAAVACAPAVFESAVSAIMPSTVGNFIGYGVEGVTETKLASGRVSPSAARSHQRDALPQCDGHRARCGDGALSLERRRPEILQESRTCSTRALR